MDNSMKDEATYWRELWEKAANAVLGLQADVDTERNRIGRVRLRLYDALNVLGGPTMHYCPPVENQERGELIKEAAKILIVALQELNQ